MRAPLHDDHNRRHTLRDEVAQPTELKNVLVLELSQDGSFCCQLLKTVFGKSAVNLRVAHVLKKQLSQRRGGTSSATEGKSGCTSAKSFTCEYICFAATISPAYSAFHTHAVPPDASFEMS